MTRDILITLAKLIATIFVVALIMLWWSAEINRAMAASLRLNPVVETDNIHLGDIFTDVGLNASHALAPAPKPGQDLVWNARTLNRIATAFNLNWRPDSAMQTISIRRAGTMIPSEHIADAILKALYDNGDVTQRMQLGMQDHDDIIVPDNADTTVTVLRAKYDPYTKMVDAVVSPADPLIKTQYSLRGRLSKVIAVPILRSTLRKGDIIGEYDVDWIDMKEQHIRPDMVISAEDIVGMTPRRFIAVGEPVHFSDLDKPKLVKRGEPVTIVYKSGRIQLTAQGRALENGAKDNVIEVANRSSNRTIQAIVTGTREVTILQ